jgi:hypothetical protein
MKMFDVLVLGLVIAVVIILIRIIVGTPLVKRVAESFASGGSVSLINTMTECPGSAVMYMHDGAAYCCSGSLRVGADALKDTCKPLLNRDSSFTFCTLGPAKPDVPNCLELRSGLMQAEGENSCPPSLPNFVKGPKGSVTENGRCCKAPGNQEMSDCISGEFCDVSTDANIFKNPASCGFIKAQHDDGPCPTDFGPLKATGTGPMADITLYGCTNSSQNCYSAATLKRLAELGYDVKGLPSCSSLELNTV